MHATPVTIAVSADFFTAFAALPRQEQGKVMAFVAKFRENPTRTGFNYEKLYNARDKRVRSVRIDDAIRCILLKPETENVYMLLWVDRHDDAYEWARKRRCEIDPQTGGLYIAVAQEYLEPVPVETPPSAVPVRGAAQRRPTSDGRPPRRRHIVPQPSRRPSERADLRPAPDNRWTPYERECVR